MPIKASASAFRHLTQNVTDAQIQLSIPSEEGGGADQFVLDLSKCFTSTLEELGNLLTILESSQALLIPTEVAIFLDSCINVMMRGGGSVANAQNFIWGVIRDILERCGKELD